MSDLIGSAIDSKQLQRKQQELRAKYQAELADKKYDNLKNVPPPLQRHVKRFIDGKSKGLGTTNKQSPISVTYPPEMDTTLRSLDNRSDYIRRAVLKQLHADGLILDYELPEPE